MDLVLVLLRNQEQLVGVSILDVSNLLVKDEPAEGLDALDGGNGVCPLMELILKPVLPHVHEGLRNDRDQQVEHDDHVYKQGQEQGEPGQVVLRVLDVVKGRVREVSQSTLPREPEASVKGVDEGILSRS